MFTDQLLDSFLSETDGRPMTREDVAIAIVDRMLDRLTVGEEKAMRLRFGLPPRPELEDVPAVAWETGLAKLQLLYLVP